MSDNVIDIRVHPRFSVSGLERWTDDIFIEESMLPQVREFIDELQKGEEELLIPAAKKPICVEGKHVVDTRPRWQQFLPFGESEGEDLTCGRSKLSEMLHPITGRTLYISPVHFSEMGKLRPFEHEFCILLNSRNECKESEPLK